MPEVNACWCGETTDEPFTADYVICSSCGSLRYAGAIELDDYTSTEGEESFYGSRYWDEYVPDVLGLPRLPERARSDLAGRSIHYLQRLLDYVGPGDAILEIGCAPGSLAALAQQAGFEVTGLELGDDVIGFIRDRFAIDVRPGPLERAALADDYDAVVMIDVLEHLPRPLETLNAAAARLRGAGNLILQTPCYRGEGADWPMLLPAEHLFLYTERSAKDLLRAAGFHPIEVGPSLFPHDMWIVAARDATVTKRKEPLAGISPLGRAMIELSGRIHDNEALITELSEELTRVRADQAAKQELIVTVSRELEEVRADQRAKQSLIERIDTELTAVRADQRRKGR